MLVLVQWELVILKNHTRLREARAVVNELLVDIFNRILAIEGESLKEKGVKLSMSEIHVLEAITKTDEPTMTNVVCGDIAMALPERILTNIIEGLDKLNHVVPGVANDETLLYAPEIKFFATQVDTSNNLETKIKGMYVAGDGPGVAGNIVSASATGLIPAKSIIANGG